MRLTGKVMMLVGGIVLIGAIAGLHYNGPQTFWQLTTREPEILTILAFVVFGLAVTSLMSESLLLPFFGSCASFYLWGQTFYDGSGSYAGLKAGFWVQAVASLAMSLGGVLAVIGQHLVDKRAAAALVSPPA